MKRFKENNCRLCPKTFCCQECRTRHEENVHQINSECEICIYGRTTIKNASVALLQHIKSAHWPLHCVFCKKIFSSLDDLIPHDKCSVKIDNMKTQATPRTPVTPVTESNEPSPMITPFYKILPSNQQITSSISMAITSTPLIHKMDSENKITPVNASDIKCVHKSSLKLTGSSNLSDSKKSERRVTFSETPSVSSECNYKKSKFLPLEKQIKENFEDSNNSVISSDDSYASIKDGNSCFKSLPSPSKCEEEKENAENQLVLCSREDSNLTMWESALTHLGLDISKKSDSYNADIKRINVSLQINVFNETVRSENSEKLDSSQCDDNESAVKPASIWSSMTNLVKNVVNNISITTQNSFSNGSTKRSQPDNDIQEGPSIKRIKLCDIKCRRPIRQISPLYQIRLGRPRYVNKATQTDEICL